MGWRQTLRAMEASARRAERESAKQRRNLQKLQAARAKMAEKAQAAHDAALYANYVEVISSLHRDCAERIRWTEIRDASEPSAPAPDTRRTEEAMAARAAYKPGFFDRWFGGESKKRAALEELVAKAIEYDAKHAQEIRQSHGEAVSRWQRYTALARAVLSLSLDGYQDAIREYEPFTEIESLSVRVRLSEMRATAIAVELHLDDPETVPRDEVKLTAGGKLATKDLTEGRYWALYQDFACSAALRSANELFALLPIDRVVSNVFTKRLNTSTGHEQSDCILALHVFRSALSSVNLEQADASDSMKNFQTRMKFKKTTGFEQVEPIALDDQWVTT